MGGEVAAQQLRVAAVLLVEARHPGQGAQLQVLRRLLMAKRGSMSMSVCFIFEISHVPYLAPMVDPATALRTLDHGAARVPAPAPGTCALARVEAGVAVAADAGLAQLLVRG